MNTKEMLQEKIISIRRTGNEIQMIPTMNSLNSKSGEGQESKRIMKIKIKE